LDVLGRFFVMVYNIHKLDAWFLQDRALGIYYPQEVSFEFPITVWLGPKWVPSKRKHRTAIRTKQFRIIPLIIWTTLSDMFVTPFIVMYCFPERASSMGIERKTAGSVSS
jgi:hypothetical protein